MKKIFSLQIISLLTIYLFTFSVSAQENQPEKIKAVKTVTGKFIRFIVGDYIHADIKNKSGKKQNFFLDSYDVQYFLVINQGKTMTFTYEIVDTYIHENGGRMTIERMKSARIGNLTFEKWWKDLRKKYSVEQIKKKYDPLVDKFTKY